MDGIDKVTGEGKFIADVKLPGMLYAKILRSPHAHADIVNIDTGAAKAVEGVHAVVTGVDLNGRLIGECINDQPPMAHTKARFVGEPVAAVIADTPEIAADACEKIRVTYNTLTPVFDPREAMKPDAPIIHEDLREYECFKTFCPIPDSNIFHHFKVRKGDVEKGFAEADRIFEHEFTYPHISHAQLEPHGCIAWWKMDGSLDIYASAQSPFLVRHVIAKLFDLPHTKVRVVVPYIGGGFGGKSDCTIEPLTAYIARFAKGRPVRLILEREEMFCGSLIGRGCHVIMKTGIKNDGTLVARKIDLAFNAGAYGEYCINIIVGGGQNSTGPYYIPNVWIDSRAIYTNLPFVGAFRGYGHPEGHFAAERQMDIIAEEMGFDPVEFRLKNCLKPGLTNAIGQTMHEHNGNLPACIKKVAESLDLDNWKKLPKEQKEDGRYARGRGFAALMKSPVMATNAPSMAQLRFNEDCSVNIQVSATDMGQGSTTALAQIASQALLLPIDKIKVSTEIDTERHPYDWQTVASRTTWMAGNAVIRACRIAIDQMKKLASDVWELNSIENIQYDGKNFFIPDSDYCLPIDSLVMGYTESNGKAMGGPATGTGYFLPPGIIFHDNETGQGNAAAEWTFACQGFDITVDKVTGMVKINKMVTAIDVGKVINPQLARGQLIGAMVQGLGAAMNEKLNYSPEGKIRNDNFTDYKIPTLEDFADTEADVIFLETPQEDGPFGARPLAEHGVVGIAPAFANAIRDALNKHYFELPITADRILTDLGKE
jgi:carbon-monoxide dehydrogenase large subunit